MISQRLTMVRETLESIPAFALPGNYSLRMFQPGDETAWTQIHLQADDLNTITPQLFAQQFGSERALLAARQFYLVNPAGETVGTGSAWFNENFQGQNFGRIHWVAILPEYQGQGLAKPLMTAICIRLSELGHERAYLTTSSTRLKAIRLYQRFGFKPFMQTSDDKAAWSGLGF